MPKAFTGNSEVLYSKVSKEALLTLDRLAKEQDVSRALYLDRAIKKIGAMKSVFVIVDKPEYVPHPPMKRRLKKK